MRCKLIALCVAAVSAFAFPAFAKPAMRHEPTPQKVLNVSTHGNGVAHQRITLSLDKAALVQLDADARDVLVPVVAGAAADHGRGHQPARLVGADVAHRHPGAARQLVDGHAFADDFRHGNQGTRVYET